MLLILHIKEHAGDPANERLHYRGSERKIMKELQQSGWLCIRFKADVAQQMIENMDKMDTFA